MFISLDMTLRRTVMTVFAFALMMGLGGLDIARSRHYCEDAAAHAEHDADYEHDEWECAVLHSGLITEASFNNPVPETSVSFIPVAKVLCRPVTPDLVAQAPRAPPRAS